MKKVTLTRFEDTGTQTRGELKVDLFSCKALERPWKLNEKNISCIPRGNYVVKWTFSWKLMKSTYEIQNVKNRSGIRFHPGNFFFDVEGCILLGSSFVDLNKDKHLDILNSRITMKHFEEFMQRETFYLEIK